MNRRYLSRAVATFAVASAASSAQALLVNIDFNTSNSPTQSGMALLGSAGDTWNGFAGASGSNRPLVDSNGLSSGLTVSFSADGVYNEICSGSPGGSSYCGTPYESLLRDYLYVDIGRVGTVTLSGLMAGASYDLVLYSAPNRLRARNTTFTANGVTEVSSFDGLSDTLIDGVSYVDMRVVADTNGRIAITFAEAGRPPGSGAGREGNLNGLQLRTVIEVPEPTSLALAAAGLLLAAGVRRRP